MQRGLLLQLFSFALRFSVSWFEGGFFGLKNLFVSRAGESLINVTQNRNSYRLLANFDGTNVILLQIGAGSVVWLTPDPSRPAYLEYYTLLSGALTLHNDQEADQDLCPGDSFYTTGIDHDVSITPKTDVRLLCFTSQPIFDDFMGFVNDLNDLNTQIDQKDHYTYNHSRRVMRFTEALCQQMHISPETTHTLLLAALYHDVGKCYQPTEILSKPGQLTDAEYAAMKRHPIDSCNLLSTRFPKAVAQIARGHHERLDGSGYPDGLTADQMTLEVRILSVADTFDAMTSDRPYKKGIPTRRAIAELLTLTHQYDAQVLAAMKTVVESGAADRICRLGLEEKR